MATRSISHQKEDQSKRHFEAAIEPWFVVAWSAKDYGIDCIVGLTTPMEGNDLRVESKFFLVQLKASEVVKKSKDCISFPVPVAKIQQWAESNVPVLFVLNDLVVNQLYYHWMDESILADLDAKNKSWRRQKDCTLRIPLANIMAADSLPGLRNYILNFKKRPAKPVESGKYFELKNKTEELLDGFTAIADGFNFPSINQSLNLLRADLDQALYRVAITGMSRVGKSSLINALLRKEVSPVEFFQTTGVPIQVIPDKEEYIEVLFKDRKKQRFGFSFQTIKEYASQYPQFNEDNKKQVSLLTIAVKNHDLQKGVCIFDIPGLDDPTDEIYDYAWATVTGAHAIIYTIDISSAQHGGFIFGKEYKKHLAYLSQSRDKIFLVFNKADAVDDEKLALVKEKIHADLKKWELLDSIAYRIYYTTTLPGKHRDSLDSITKLDKDLWNFIVSENKYGIVRLSEVITRLDRSCQDFTSLLHARLLDISKKAELTKAIGTIQNKTPALKKDFTKRVEDFEVRLFHQLEVWKNERLDELHQWLKAQPAGAGLPGKNEVKKFLRLKLNEVLERGNHEYVFFIRELKEFADNWIEEHLQQIRQILSAGANKKTFDTSELEALETPAIELASSLGMGIITGFAAFLLNPAIALGAGIFAALSNYIMSSESIKAKRIDKYMTESKKRYDKTFDNLKKAYKDLIEEQTDLIGNYIADKLSLYFSDLQGQLSALEKTIPENDREKYNIAFEQLKDLYKKAVRTQVEIQGFTG